MFDVSLPYKHNSPLMDEVPQFDINYNSQKNDFEKLMNFVEKYQDKRINIHLASPADIDKIKIINKVYKNIYLKFDSLIFLNKITEEDKFKYYFTFPIGSYTQLNQIFQFNVSDIYIADDLCYALKDVKEICDSNSVEIRLIANTIPSIGIKGLSIKDPIFRPEDYDILSKYINTIEFAGDAQETLYKVWVKNHKWYGNLQEINSDIQFEFPNKTIIDLYKNKYNCNLTCVKGGNCSVCDEVLRLAATAQEHNLIYKHN